MRALLTLVFRIIIKKYIFQITESMSQAVTDCMINNYII